MKQQTMLIWIVVVLLLGAILRLLNLTALETSNAYYTGAVVSMLQSPYHFFFIVAEPGASVMVDKPPLALWVQALSIMALGLNSFGVIFPQIACGLLNMALLYRLVRRYHGARVAIIATFVLSTTSLVVAVDRSNLFEPLLITCLLIATRHWFNASEQGRWRDLLLAGVWVGIAFHVKMAQAFLVLPAFYSLYWIGTPVSRWRKVVHLSGVSLVIGLVSSIWLLTVALTPPEYRPYIGSTNTNSVLELVIGYNGIDRILGQVANPNISPHYFELGNPALLRLWQAPLATQSGWLLPFVLLCLPVLIGHQRWSLRGLSHQRSLVFWVSWLLPQVAVFSIANFYHTYYLVMLAPAIATLVGLGTMAIWRECATRRLIGWGIFLVVSGLVLSYQISIAMSHVSVFWLGIVFGGWVLGMVVLLHPTLAVRRGAIALCFVSIHLIPVLFAGLTTLTANPDGTIPRAYPAPVMPATVVNEAVIDYLQAGTADMPYLVAMPSAMVGSPYIISTGRPILLVGGFQGLDPIYTAESFEAMVARGEVRYVWDIGGQLVLNPLLQAWIRLHCEVLSLPDTNPLIVVDRAQIVPAQANPIYDCLPAG